MGNIWRGILYTGLTAATGVAGYLVGKYKHMKGVSLTMIGLALVLYAPKGCDVLETYIKTSGEVEKAKIYGVARKDSIDKAISVEKLRDSTSYLRQSLKNTITAGSNIEKTYKALVERTELEYRNLLKKNDAKYVSTLNSLSKQNELLKNNLDALITMQLADKVSVTQSTGSLSTNLDPYIMQGDYGELINSEILDDGTRIDTRRFQDSKVMKFTYSSGAKKRNYYSK